jgi:hypothetical protein
MSEQAKFSWTETDLDMLIIGQSESIRREFKSGRLFDGNQENTWIQDLSKEVSALANTEGGELFLGIAEEKRSKPRVAIAIDGVTTTLAPERLQQLIEGNVSPYLPGIRVTRVRLSRLPDRVVFVVHIPQGSTAYQAKDGRYYGRSEFEAKHLPDHEIRLRMSRGRVARGTVRIRLLQTVLGAELESRIRAKHAEAIQLAKYNAEEFATSPAVLEFLSAQSIRDKITFGFVFRNDGEITIRAPAIEFYETRSQWLLEGGQAIARLPKRIDLDEEIIYPGDERTIGSHDNWLECERKVLLADRDYVVHWKVFLDNSPPTTGEIDLGSLMMDARMQHVTDLGAAVQLC